MTATTSPAGGRRLGRLPLLLGAALLLSPPGAAAQSGFVTLQLSFSNPGARSLGLGGAFVALADDATAAFANPAGLVQLLAPEVSIEGRSWGYDTPFTRSGRLDGEPSGIGLDRIAGLEEGGSRADLTGLSFLSFTYPRERWSLAVYRHQLANFEFASETQGLFALPFPPAAPGVVRREIDIRAATDLEIVAWGLAGAWRVSEALSLGIGVVYFDSELSGRENRYLVDSPERFFLENSYLDHRRRETLVFVLDDAGWGLSAGFLWRPSPRWSFGGFYRQGPETELTGEALAGPALEGVPPGTRLDGETSPLDFPDVFGLGFAYRWPGDRLTFSFEWDRVEYGDLLESVTFDVEQAIDDGHELRAGAEYVFLYRRPVTAVRCGVWLDPDHRIRDVGNDPLSRGIFRPGRDELHFAFGLGLAFRSFQLDFAADLSAPVDTLALSTIYSF